MSTVLWFMTGIGIGAVGALVLPALWRAPAGNARPPWWRYALPLVAAGVLVSATLIVYRLRDSQPVAVATSGDKPDGTAMTASHSAAISEYRDKVTANPRDSAAWATLASLYRQQHDYAQAREAYTHLIALDAMSADSWADYADVQASLSGSLAGDPAGSIDRALALDPAHPKALWLKASLAHQQGKETEALALWTRLRATLPEGSSDARLVDDNIAEARRLTGAGGNMALPPGLP